MPVWNKERTTVLSTVNEIKEYIVNQTKNLDFANLTLFTANYVSEQTNISRSLASQYLNDLHKAGHLIKINSRPVYFFSKQILELRYQNKFERIEFDSIDLFKKYLFKDREDGGVSIIGEFGSLKTSFDKSKSALMYPPYGLPFTIIGERGTGKKTLVNSIIEYAIKKGVLKSKSAVSSIIVNNDKLDLEKAILGSGGYLENNVFYFDDKFPVERELIVIYNAENLNSQQRSFLTKFADNPKMSRVNRKEIFDLKKQILLVFNSRKNNIEINNFINKFPINVPLPSFFDRLIQEREQIIISTFSEEAVKIQKKIFVTRKALDKLINFDYQENIVEVKNTIKNMCAQANLNVEKAADIYLNVYNLPMSHIQDNAKEHAQDKLSDRYIDILDYKYEDYSLDFYDFYQRIIASFVTINKQQEISLEEIMPIAEAIKNISGQNKILFNKQISLKKSLEYLLFETITDTFNKYNLFVPNSFLSFLSRSVFLEQVYNYRLKTLEKENYDTIDNFLQLLKLNFEDESFILETIIQNLMLTFEYELSRLNQIFLLIIIIENNRGVVKRKNIGLIICHGTSTASSIADAANTLLNSYVFDAYDMPIDTSPLKIAGRVEKYIENSSILSDVLLLVDMGSLQEIDKYLNHVYSKNIGIISGVSTKVALDVGTKILNNNSVESIVESTKNSKYIETKVLKNAKKRKTIIFFSENGIHMADKLRKLFVGSLPVRLGIDVISLELSQLENQELIGELDVLFISGTHYPGKTKYEFISIDDIVVSTDLINDKLSSYLSPAEMIHFKENIIKNFSLENLVSNLTILDPTILLNYVIEAVANLEKLLNVDITGETKIGIYIHISCLIERLVTKEPIESSTNLEQFVNTQQQFIMAVRKSFETICKHYRVEIPDSEVSYLYDYIINDKGWVRWRL